MSEIEQRQIFCENLNRIMNERGYAQVDVAAAIDVSPSRFNTWMQGKAIPRMGKLQALADYFGIPKSELIEKHVPDLEPDVINDLLQELKSDPQIRMLLSSTKDLDEESITLLIDMAKKLRGSYRDT